MACDGSVSGWTHTVPKLGFGDEWCLVVEDLCSQVCYIEFHFSGVPVLLGSFELSFVLRGAAAAAAWQSQ